MNSVISNDALTRRLLSKATSFPSPEELSKAVNGQLTPAQAITRVKDLIASRDVYSDLEKRQLLFYDMAELLESLKQRAKEWHDDKAIQSYIRTLKLLSDQLERNKLDINDISTKLSEAQGAYFFAAISAGYQAMAAEFEKRGIKVDPDDEKQILIIGATEGLKELKRHIESEQ